MEIHRRVAAMIATDPDRVLGKARDNLHRWSLARQGSAAGAVLTEWLNLLEKSSPNEVAEFLVSGSARAVRMRQSSPFAGVLPPREVWAIKRNSHEAA